MKEDRKKCIHAGVDVHDKTYVAALWSQETRTVVKRWTQPSSAEQLVRSLEPYRGEIRRVVYEAGITGFELARALVGAGYEVEVIAPKSMARGFDEAKSDRLDCAALARLDAAGELRYSRIPTREEEADRQVVRMRENVAVSIRRVKVQIKCFLMQYSLPRITSWSRRGIEKLCSMELPEKLRFSLDILLCELKSFVELYKEVEKKIAEMSSKELYAGNVERLTEIKGVGVLTAMTYLTEIFRPEEMTGGIAVGKHTGLAPQVSRSGSGLKRKGSVLSGNKRLKRVLVEAAWRWAFSDPLGRRYFSRYRKLLGSSQKAIVAVARKLSIIMWMMVTKNESYRVAG